MDEAYPKAVLILEVVPICSSSMSTAYVSDMIICVEKEEGRRYNISQAK